MEAFYSNLLVGICFSVFILIGLINTDIKYSDDKEYVNIDGINYKKV